MSKTSKFTGKSGSRIEDWYGESGIEDRFKKLENTLGGRDFSGAVSCFCQVFMSSLYSDSLRRSWLRPTAEDVCFDRHRKFPPHTRKTAGTQGNMGQKLKMNFTGHKPRSLY